MKRRETLHIGVGLVGGTLLPSAVAAGNEREIRVSFDHSTLEIEPTQEATVDIAIENPVNGVGAFMIEVSVSDPTIVDIVEVELAKDPLVETIEITDDSLLIEAAQGTNIHESADEVVICTCHFEASTSGETTLSFAKVRVSDRDDDIYSVDEATDATIEVTPHKPLFETDIVETNSPVSAGDPVVVTVEITNTGERSARQTIELEIDELGMDAIDVELAAGESMYSELTVPSESTAAGSYVVTVTSDDTTETDTVKITAAEENEVTHDETDANETSSDETGNGFGIVGPSVGLGTLSYLLWQKVRESDVH